MNEPSLTDTLCTRCGLCCDGSLFADVELATSAEAELLEVLGLEIEDDDGHRAGVLIQPCQGLNGTRCRIYPYRPDCCRTFECHLLQEVKRGLVSVPQAKAKIAETLGQIQRLKHLLSHLDRGPEDLPLKERCVDALLLSAELVDDLAIRNRRRELETALAALERLIKASFLTRPAR